MQKYGHIFIISAPSGSGKTTLVSRLIKHNSNIRVCVSHTSRPPREGEVDGVSYHFVSKDEFRNMIYEGAFVEHASVYGNYYGTSSAELQSLIQQGYDVVLEIDTQGAEQIRHILPNAMSIFILPPSFSVLRERLEHRSTDSKEVIEARLARVRSEVEQAFLFDYIVVNDSLDEAEKDLLHVIRSHDLKRKQQEHFLQDFLTGI